MMRAPMRLEEFYALDPQRARSREVSYGTLWRRYAPVPVSRLAWVEATGELYAVELTEPDERHCPVDVLGVLWSRPQVEACLAGWTERDGDQRSLLWVRDCVRKWRPVTEETQFTEADPEPSRLLPSPGSGTRTRRRVGLSALATRAAAWAKKWLKTAARNAR